MKKLSVWLRAPLLLAVALGIGACERFPTKPSNRRPTISSIEVFPPVIGQGDSLLITVYASDPDGDTLVYDWTANGDLRIKGAVPGSDFLYHTSSNSRVIYRSSSPFYDDTTFVWCEVRDVKGGGHSRMALIFLRD